MSSSTPGAEVHRPALLWRSSLGRVAPPAGWAAEPGPARGYKILQIRKPQASRSSVMSGAVRLESQADDREAAGKLAEATLVSGAGRASQPVDTLSRSRTRRRSVSKFQRE